MKLVATASQTVGPFFGIGLGHLSSAQPSIKTTPVTVHGRVIDGNGDSVPDAVLEFWQADPFGHYASSPPDASGLASGFVRIVPDVRGCFTFTTCCSGPVPFDDARPQAPHLVVLVFARGLLRQLITRMYFPDEPGNATDPVLQSLSEERRKTLIAQCGPKNTDTLVWNIVLQGEDETVFFVW
jgi:protocatechuate 3,4-dioxygenase alpha subunit